MLLSLLTYSTSSSISPAVTFPVVNLFSILFFQLEQSHGQLAMVLSWMGVYSVQVFVKSNQFRRQICGRPAGSS
jgi:hypothetical protein